MKWHAVVEEARERRFTCQEVVNRLLQENGVAARVPEDADRFRHLGGWEAIHETEPLDVISSDPDGCGFACHVAIVVEPGYGGKVVSMEGTSGYLQPYLCKPWQMRGILGVYRCA